MKQDVSKKYNWLNRRGNIWQFRRRVPGEIRDVIGKTEIVLSLKTGDLKTAQKLYSAVAADVQKQLDEAYLSLEASNPQIIPTLIAENLAHDWYAKEIPIRIEDARNSFVSGSLAARIEELDQEEAFLLDADDRNSSAGIRKLAHEILLDAGYPEKPITSDTPRRMRHLRFANVIEDNEGFEQLLSLVLRGELVIIRNIRDVLGGMPIENYDEFFHAKTSNQFNSNAVKTDALTLGMLVDKYLNADPSRSNRTTSDYEAAFRPMLEVIGERRPVSELVPADFKPVRALIEGLPPNARKRKDRENLSYNEIAELVQKNGEQTLSITSVSKYLSRIKALFTWATEQWEIERNPTEGILAGLKDHTPSKEKRYPFSSEALNVIFRSEHHAKPNKDEPSKYWAPIISLFHGMRLEEILQLQLADLQEEEGVKFFDLHERDGNHLKRGAARKVPIHPILFELKFESLITSSHSNKNGRLFSDVKRGSEGKFGSAYSQWYSRYLEKLRVKTPKTSFHSYRHTFRDAGRSNDLGEQATCAIGGWAFGSGAHVNYGSGLWMEHKAEAIRKIHYPGLDIANISIIGW